MQLKSGVQYGFSPTRFYALRVTFYKKPRVLGVGGTLGFLVSRGDGVSTGAKVVSPLIRSYCCTAPQPPT